jgi:GLPGLI family protein
MTMMMNKYLIPILFLLCSLQSTLSAQTVLQHGVVTYEKKTNLHKQMESWGDNSWIDQMKKNLPKFKVENFDLQFAPTASTFKKSAEQPPADPRMRGGFMGGDDDEKNVTYKSMDSNKIIAMKQVFEKLVLLKDTLPKMHWKITNEFKKIADYNCRKATTIIMDSIYVIAFYTDAIQCSSGPESLNGLPGMILGVVLPRMNTSYFAKSVTSHTEPKLEPIPSKGKPYTYVQIIDQLNKSLDDWGKKWKSRSMWGILL